MSRCAPSRDSSNHAKSARASRAGALAVHCATRAEYGAADGARCAPRDQLCRLWWPSVSQQLVRQL
eukprot:4879616-Prymnesium_polylepis.1